MKIAGLVTLIGVALALILGVGLMAARDRGAAPAAPTHTTTVTPPVQVFVYKDTKPGAVTYGYRVVNGSAFEITSLAIGYDYYTNTPQLRIAPIGWDGNSVASTAARSPADWALTVTQVEDDSLVYMVWRVDTLKTGILGGATKLGFEVTLPEEDDRYTTGKWVVYLNSASQSYYAGSIDASAVTSAPPSSIHGPNGVRVKPNPSLGGVTIEFSAPSPGACTIDVLDAMGRSVRRISSALSKPGHQSAIWDGKDDAGRPAPPAVYFLRIQAPTMDRFAKFVLEK